MIKEKEEDKVEALKTVELVEGEIAKTTRIGTTLSPEMRTRLKDGNKSPTRRYPVRPDPNGSDFTRPDK